MIIRLSYPMRIKISRDLNARALAYRHSDAVFQADNQPATSKASLRVNWAGVPFGKKASSVAIGMALKRNKIAQVERSHGKTRVSINRVLKTQPTDFKSWRWEPPGLPRPRRAQAIHAGGPHPNPRFTKGSYWGKGSINRINKTITN